MTSAIAFVAGLLFGLGLWISGMTDPGKIVGFLDVAGRWDPSLMFVFVGAASVTVVAFRFVLRSKRPWLAASFHLPHRHEIDRELVLGSALFGIGWALGGYCPGPALTSLPTLAPEVVVFVIAMIIGGFAYGPARHDDRT